MIDVRDVVKMYIPFPNICADLAVKEHMYICVNKSSEKELVKCQTFKPKHLTKNGSRSLFLIEIADPARNPFTRTTAIEYGKVFRVCGCLIGRDNAKSICVSLFNAIQKMIRESNARKYILDTDDLITLNSNVTRAT